MVSIAARIYLLSSLLLAILDYTSAAQDFPNPYRAAKTGGNYMINYYLPPAPSSYPWWPCWSPDGKWIAFSMQGSIWKIAVGSSVAYELTHDQYYDSSPSWSPDGNWIVYTADAGGRSINLMLLNLETGNSNSLTYGDQVNVDPVWSPDGKSIAYVSTFPNGYFNIFIMEILKGKPGRTLQLTEDHQFGKARLYFGDFDLHIEPTWSPDGKEIIFLSNRDISLGSGSIWRMPVEPRGMAKARLLYHEQTLYRTRPDWSPDGKSIVYSSHLGGQFNNLYILPADGGEPYKMTFGDWDAFHPRWSPDGEWIAYISNEQGLPELRLLKTFGGKQIEVKIQEKRWTRPMGRVIVRLQDQSSNEITSARVYAWASDGKFYTPDSAFSRVGRQGEHFFYGHGTFEMEVPTGALKLEAIRGFEYYPISEVVQIEPGKTSFVTLFLRRMTEMASKGWYSGDNHVHLSYGGNLHNSPARLMEMADAEDLNIVTALVANKDNRILGYQYFTGDVDKLSNDRRLLYFNEEYRPPFYGHISLINLRDHLISPFTTGYEGTALESLYPSNTDILRMASQQHALGAYVHPFAGSDDPLSGNLGEAKAFPVDLALGTVTYHELMSEANQAGLDVWHRALNNGFRVTAVGGEDSITDLQVGAPIGQDRAYGYLGPKLTWDGWIEAIREGKVFVTNGPLLEFSVNAQIPGGSVSLPEGGRVKVKGSIQSIAPIEKIEIVFDGKVLVTIPPGDGVSIRFERDLFVSKSGWFTLQVSGTHPVHPIDDRYPQATTNPVWVFVGGRPVRTAESAQYFIRWIDKLIAMTNNQPGWRSPAEKAHVIEQFRDARKIYERLFVEAKNFQ
jgi:Tol biopolymer transport system component